jgi:hypothetical protein
MREYFINADFDLSLRRGRPAGIDDARARQARELEMQMLLLGVEGDSVLVRTEPQVEFLEYLERLRIPVLELRVQPRVTGPARFTPFGWNEEAERINHQYDDRSSHPPLGVVRRVNGRAFSSEIERRHFGGEFFIGVVHSTDELSEMLNGRPPDEDGWVVKSEHGNGAFGNRRLRSRTLSGADLKALRRLFNEDESAVLEPWCERVLDIASVFEVNQEGDAAQFYLHEVVNTADGAFIGDVFDADHPAVRRWEPDLVSMAEIVAQELADAGYFGPVCVDSFVWEDHGAERLRPVVDVNARLFVAAGAARLWRIWSREPVVYWRLFSRRRLIIPDTFEEAEKALGAFAYNPETRHGILLTSPLEVGGRRPRRLGVLLAGRDRRSVDELDRWFRGRFET